VSGGDWVPLTGPDGSPSDWSIWPQLMFRTAGTDARRATTFSAADDTGFPPLAETTARARAVLADPWFAEALSWQNAHVAETWTTAGWDSAKPAELRRRNSRLAMFLQRYATKNDTVGFFGPVAWARLDQSLPGVLAGVGRGDEVRRRSYFEPWVIQSLAEVWERDPALRPWLRPRLDPSATLTGAVVHGRHGVRLAVSAEEAAVLALCDGCDTVVRIAARLGTTPDAVLSTVDKIVAEGLATLGFQLPLTVHQDECLAARLAEVEHPAGAAHLAELRALQAGRAAVDATAGQPARLRAALAGLDARYAEIAGRSPVRRKDDHADNRTPLWTDALADWDPVLGAAALDGLAAPLAMVLDACRWATARIADAVEAMTLDLLAEVGGGPLPFETVFDELRPELTGRSVPVVTAVVSALQKTVASLVELPTDTREVRLTSADLGPAWRTEFAAPGPGWADAAVHSPDVMLAAADPAAANAGAHLWVLGEVHAAMNTLDMPLATLHARDFVDVERLVLESTPAVRHGVALPRNWARISPRCLPVTGVPLPDRDVRWTLWSDDILPRETPLVPGTALRVANVDGRPVVTGPGPSAPLVDVVGTFLSIAATGVFQPFAPARHTPRVVVDRLVLQRERWCLPLPELAAVLGRSGGEAEVAARLRALGVPRYTFVRFPREPKPFFCDLRAEPLLKNVVRLLRVGRSGDVVRFEEMLPRFEDLWLTRAGGRHTSEFRMVARDARRGFAS
jgi:lantibiotic biosynthesis dehydratase-like protein